MCVETGEIFSCQQAAVNKLGLKGIGSIHHALKEPRFVAAGFHFVQGDLIDALDSPDKRIQYLSQIIQSK